MTRHYQELKLFNWLRKKVFKIDKPYALPWGEWDKWKDRVKSEHPVGYFLTETLPEWLELPAEKILDPLYDVKYYLRNRFITKTHVLDTGLEKGKWHEFDRRILHGMFNELVDFVEVEQAWHTVIWDSEKRKKYQTPKSHNYRFLRWGEWRCPEAGIDYYKWSMSLDGEDIASHERNPGHAEYAREIMFLYTWWKEVYLKRPDDAYDAVGYYEYVRQLDEKYGRGVDDIFNTRKYSPSERKERDRLSDLAHKTEEEWYEEENDMLIRLIKIRRNLWT